MGGNTAAGGIFNQYATVAFGRHAFTPYVFVHEFGHHFAGLADEYYTCRRGLRPGRRTPGALGANVDPPIP